MSDDDARYEYEAVVTLTFQTTADDAQKCLERSGFFGGALIGETMVDTIEIYAPDAVTDAKPYPKAKQLGRGERRYRRAIASPKKWAAIMDAKRGPCRVCGRATTHLQAFRAGSVTFHHVVPRDFGGDDLADNIVPLCFTCHEKVTGMNPRACLALCSSLTDAEYAYAIGKLGEGAFERVYRVVLT